MGHGDAEQTVLADPHRGDIQHAQPEAVEAALWILLDETLLGHSAQQSVRARPVHLQPPGDLTDAKLGLLRGEQAKELKGLAGGLHRTIRCCSIINR
jgi:hypothetical protein